MAKLTPLMLTLLTMEGQEVAMTFTCDSCHGEYRAERANALAHVFVEDPRCNHLVTRCTGCGTQETIFLGAHRLADEVRLGRIVVMVEAEASGTLRVRAENAWAAAQQPSSPPPPPPETLERYELTSRHERLLAEFADTLSTIPDDLLWDGLQSDHERRLPERWTD